MNDRLKKIVCIAGVFISAAITIYYLTITGLFGNESALSTVGLEHPFIFTIWGITVYFALAFNIYAAFSKTKFKFYIIFLVIAFIGMLLTLSCDFDYDKHTQYIFHCIGSLTFSVVSGILVFLAFLLQKHFALSFVCATILLIDLIMLLIFKETALIEVVPIFLGYVLLLSVNLQKKGNEIETV